MTILRPVALWLVKALAQSVEAAPDHLSVPIVGKCIHGGSALFQMVTCCCDVAKLAMALSNVEVQGRVEPSHRTHHPRLRGTAVGDQVCRLLSSKIPNQFLTDIVLHISHRVCQRAAV